MHKMSLEILVPVNLGPEKGTGRAGGEEGKRWRLKEVSASSRDFFKLNSGPGTVSEGDGPGSSQSLLFPNRKVLHEIHLQCNVYRGVVLALQILQMWKLA